MRHIYNRPVTWFLFYCVVLFLAGCGTQPKDAPPQLRVEPASFSDLDGWRTDNMSHVMEAFHKSCDRILKNPADRAYGIAGTYGDWHQPCRDALAIKNDDETVIRQFFEQNFQPHSVMNGSDPEGLFTGYFEASLNGSTRRYGPYQTPIRARPDDLVMVDLGEFRDDLKGRRIAGRIKDGRLRPYEDRTEIVGGGLPAAQEKILFWVDDPLDAFFLQIQGSGRIRLDDGRAVRVGYAGQNGHPYYAIGRELVKRNHLKKEDVSLQSIRAWLEAHPDQADEILNTNASYVFFRVLDETGPVGGEGLVLTQGRSLAIDRSLMPYGLPFWVDIAPPAKGEPPLRRLMIGQDTGGAIRGAVRGDVFWGYGDKAEFLAGQMKSQGRYWVLLPRK